MTSFRAIARTRNCGSPACRPTRSWPSHTARLARCARPAWLERWSDTNFTGVWDGEIFARGAIIAGKDRRLPARKSRAKPVVVTTKAIPNSRKAATYGFSPFHGRDFFEWPR